MSWNLRKTKNDNSDKNRDKPKKDTSATKGHWSNKIGIRKISPNTKSAKTRFVLHCPRSCQQRANGSRGKKTYDGSVCNSCGYKR